MNASEPDPAALRDASEEIGAVEQLLEDVGETGNARADELLRIAKARLGHANGRLVATINPAEPPARICAEEKSFKSVRFSLAMNPQDLASLPRRPNAANHNQHKA